MNLSKPQEMVKDREAWCTAVRGVTEMDTAEQLTSLLYAAPSLSSPLVEGECAPS